MRYGSHHAEHANGLDLTERPVSTPLFDTGKKTLTAGISEIFSSLQGEGPHIGEPHIFVRFEHCNIHCVYCDELGKPARAMDGREVFGRVLELERLRGPHRFVSLTGGEPLLYIDFLEPLIRQLRREKFPIYLETSGILTKALLRIVDAVDVVAMDIKLKSVTREKRNYFEEHRAFLRLARRAPDVFVKMIVDAHVDADEFLQAVRIMEYEHSDIPLVLQGVTGAEVNETEQKETLRMLQQRALQYLSDVRIIPRLHVVMGLR